MAISNSDIPQPLWERAVALVQKQGMPVNASTIQSAMNTLAEGGSGGAETNVGMDSQIDSLMARTDKAPVTSAPLVTPLPTEKPAQFAGAGMDEIALNNLHEDSGRGGVPRVARGQGPASLNSHEAEASDPRDPDKIAYAGNTQNAAPGTQGMNDMGLEDAGAVGGMGMGDAAMAGGGLAALIATLTKRNKPSMGQSMALGNAQARPAINQFEGMMKEATPDELKKARAPARSSRGGRSGGSARRPNPKSKTGVYEPDMTLM